MITSFARNLKQNPVLFATGFASALLLGYMNIHDGPLFSALTLGRTIPDSDFSATPQSLLALRQMLEGRPEAAVVIRNMHLYADMALPVLLGLFLVLLIRKLAQGAVIYGRPATRFLPVLLALPVLYTLCDYAENAASLMFFPPSTPSDPWAATLAISIYWLTRIKFTFVALACLMAIRLALRRGNGGTAAE